MRGGWGGSSNGNEFQIKKLNKNYDVPFSSLFPTITPFHTFISILFSNNPFFISATRTVAHLNVQVKIIIIKWYIMLLGGANISKSWLFSCVFFSTRLVKKNLFIFMLTWLFWSWWDIFPFRYWLRILFGRLKDFSKE